MTVPIVAPQATDTSDSPNIRVPVTNPNYHPLPGRVGNLTEVQQQTLDKLREELKDEGHFVKKRMDDAMLLRCTFSVFHCYFSCLMWSCAIFFLSAPDSCVLASSTS